MQNSAPNSKKCSKGAQRNRERPNGGREGFIPDLKKCLKASYIEKLIKMPFEFDGVFKLQIV